MGSEAQTKWVTYGDAQGRMVHLREGDACQVRVRGHWYTGKVAVLTSYAAVIWYTPKSSGWEQGTVIAAADVPSRVLDRDDDNAC